MNKLDLVLGLYDDPENQKQDNYKVDLYKNNIAIIGGAMSGKTTLLKTLLIRMHQELGLTDKEEIYILDFNNSLSDYGRLPYVRAYFDAMQEENIRRIFIKVEELFNNNVRQLAGKSYSDCEEDQRPSHITFIIDGINTFFAEDNYSQYQNTLQRIARDGLSKGVSIVFTANETAGGISRLLNSFKTIIGFEMPKDKYTELFNTHTEKPISVKGRGLATLNNNVYEFQAYYPYNMSDEELSDETAVEEINRIYKDYFCKESEYADAQQAAENSEILAKIQNNKMISFTKDLTRKTWKYYKNEEFFEYYNKCDNYEAPMGLEYYTLSPITVDLSSTRAIAIYGRKKSGKSNVLSLLIDAAIDKIPNCEFIIWEDERRGICDEQRAPYVQRALKRAQSNNIKVRYCFSQMEFEDIIGEYYNIPSSMIGDDQYVRSYFRNKNNIESGRLNYNNVVSVNNDSHTSKQEINLSDSNWENFSLDAADDYLDTNEEFQDNAGEDLREPLDEENHYFDVPKSHEYDYHEDRTSQNETFKIIIVQSRSFYQKGIGTTPEQFIQRISPYVSTGGNKLFIFSDVQRITDSENSIVFNNWIDQAFLLDDLLKFMTSTRGKNSVFKDEDEEEIKERFGKCDIGDGFYFNVGFDRLDKLKFILQVDSE